MTASSESTLVAEQWGAFLQFPSCQVIPVYHWRLINSCVGTQKSRFLGSTEKYVSLSFFPVLCSIKSLLDNILQF